MSTQSSHSTDKTTVARPIGQVMWLDPVKGVALAWVVLNHIAERLFGFPYIGNPNAHWPAWSERVAQLQPLSGFGVFDLPFNALRYVGWLGDFGVSLFLLVSGFGLAMSVARRGHSDTGWWHFLQRRARRIYPSWWWAHLLFIVPLALIGVRFNLLDPTLWWSFVGVRMTPEQLYYGAPAWWFVGLLLQLYLVFPLLWWLLRNLSPGKFIVTVVCITALSRALGFWYLDDAIDFWSRGGFFITRLAEFATGMALAVAFHNHPETSRPAFIQARWLMGAGITFVAAIVLSLTWVGKTVSPWLAGISTLLLTVAVFYNRQSESGVFALLGRWSLPVFLVHHPIVLVVCPDDPTSITPTQIAVRIVACLVLIAIGSALFESSRRRAWQAIQWINTRWVRPANKRRV